MLLSQFHFAPIVWITQWYCTNRIAVFLKLIAAVLSIALGDNIKILSNPTVKN